MKLLSRVKGIDVKRCFVIADRVKRRPLPEVKKAVLNMSERELDRVLLRKNQNRRRDAYNAVKWHLALVSPNEVGVWKRAGGLPLRWTKGSLAQTARLVTRALKNGLPLSKPGGRARSAIPGILAGSLPLVQKEKYLLPIILPGGTMGRKGCRKMRGDIDDGCMRSVALAVSGACVIKAYIGVKPDTHVHR